MLGEGIKYILWDNPIRGWHIWDLTLAGPEAFFLCALIDGNTQGIGIVSDYCDQHNPYTHQYLLSEVTTISLCACSKEKKWCVEKSKTLYGNLIVQE